MKGKYLLIALCGVAAFSVQALPAATKREIRAAAEKILEDPQAPVVQGKDQSQAWVSNAWLLIKPLSSDKIEAINVPKDKTVWIDASSFSTGEAARIISAVRLHDGFLLSGLEEPIPGTVYSSLTKYDAQGKKKNQPAPRAICR